jgi:hypothetical protein
MPSSPISANVDVQRTVSFWGSFIRFPGDDVPPFWIPPPQPPRAPEPPRRTSWRAPRIDDLDDESLRDPCRHLHRLGDRSVYEAMRAILGGADVALTLDEFGRLDPGVLGYLGGGRLQ